MAVTPQTLLPFMRALKDSPLSAGFCEEQIANAFSVMVHIALSSGWKDLAALATLKVSSGWKDLAALATLKVSSGWKDLAALATLKENERQLSHWEFRQKLLKRMKAGYDHALVNVGNNL
ncbi:hypothetical protein ACOMHN_062049 [Nucella lapillus]